MKFTLFQTSDTLTQVAINFDEVTTIKRIRNDKKQCIQLYYTNGTFLTIDMSKEDYDVFEEVWVQLMDDLAKDAIKPKYIFPFEVDEDEPYKLKDRLMFIEPPTVCVQGTKTQAIKVINGRYENGNAEPFLIKQSQS